MSDKELIKEEIERRYNCEKYHPLDREANVAAAVLQELLLFIDSLPEEPASEDLEEEIERFLDEDENIPSYSKTARHFAEWGRNHFNFTPEMVSEDLEEEAKKFYTEIECYPPSLQQYSNHIEKAFKAGAKWQKQQIKETLQTEYEKGRFDMKEEFMKTILQKRIEKAKQKEYPLPSIVDGAVCKVLAMAEQTAYKKGATFALQNQWISVEKKLPEITKPLLARKGSEIMFAVFEQGLFHLMEGTTIEGITHWMEIPKLGGEE